MYAINIKQYKQKLVAPIKIPIPRISDDEVLVKTKYAPINPSDIGFSMGVYGIKPNPPITIGFEGSGVVQEVGANVPKDLIGSPVTCYCENAGTWAEYFVTKPKYCIKIPKNDSVKLSEQFKQFASSFINPMTSYGFYDFAQQNNHKCIVQTLAHSQVGKMNIELFKNKGIKTINILRDEQFKQELYSLGADQVLNSSTPSFRKNLQQLIKELNPTCFIDGVGGELFSQIITDMPNNAQSLSYGMMAKGGAKTTIDLTQLLFRGKVLRGFWMVRYINEQEKKNNLENVANAVGDLVNRRIISTTIQKTFKLANVGQAIEQYLKNMDKGKVLLEC